jgi:hypothetical protein
MARNGWSRWGRGDCEGYSLEIGDGAVRFHARVVRSVRNQAGLYSWSACVNGHGDRHYAVREVAMAHVETELASAAAFFLTEFEAYKAGRAANKYSRAVDAAYAAYAAAEDDGPA